jgi:succinate dehydrogenase flavin-adding protein (antitoxin of CptAB toxin-antitoxin module)
MNQQISINSATEIHIKRLQWRSRRSMLEVDLYLDRFMHKNGLESLNPEELRCYEDLLELNDWDFLALLQGSDTSCDVLIQNVINKILNS